LGIDTAPTELALDAADNREWARRAPR